MKMVVGIGLLFIALLAQVCQAQQQYSLGDIEVNSFPSYTQIRIPVPEGTEYVAGEVKTPPQIIMNLYPVKTNLPYREIAVVDRFIQKISLIKDSENVVKAIVDLNTREYNFNIFSQNEPAFVVVEIGPPRKDIVAALLNLDSIEIEANENLVPLGSWQQVSDEAKERYRIVIDPGHGGKDPGAIGPSGIKEKDIQLPIAHKLAVLLRENLDVEVYLTREGDEFISLDRRTEIANLLKGDLFISIHANAAWDARARGVETFYNSHYPYGEGAEEVAIRENTALAAEGIPSQTKTIIWDLIQNQYRQKSKELSLVVQEKLAEALNLTNRGVKSAPFYVLRGANMPAILTEVGFISNPWEERQLKNVRFQEIIASGIYKGIAIYLNSF